MENFYFDMYKFYPIFFVKKEKDPVKGLLCVKKGAFTVIRAQLSARPSSVHMYTLSSMGIILPSSA